jgi:Tol biopolymer transport system component
MKCIYSSIFVFLLALIGCGTTDPGFNLDKAPTITMNASELTRITDTSLIEYNVRISPDGKQILAKTKNISEQNYANWYMDCIDLKTKIRKRVSDIHSTGVSWLPDGSGFVYVLRDTDTSRSQLVRASIDAMCQEAVVISGIAKGMEISDPDISPDGLFLALSIRENSRTMGLAISDFEGRYFEIFGRSAECPRWSPDGTKVAFETWSIKEYEVNIPGVWVLDVERNKIVQSIPWASSPCWSPDGKWIVYSTSHYTNGYSLDSLGLLGRSILCVNTEGSFVRLTKGRTGDRDPFWSSDGYIYFSSYDGVKANIWRLKPIFNQVQR